MFFHWDSYKKLEIMCASKVFFNDVFQFNFFFPQKLTVVLEKEIDFK